MNFIVVILMLGLGPKLKHENMSKSNECFKTQTPFHKCGKVSPKSQVDFSH